MKAAIITGASSGIGLSITKRLIPMGYKVFGLARDFSSTIYEDVNFIKITCDVTKTSELIKQLDTIKETEDIYMLVNNAGVGYFAPHEELNPKKLHAMVATNLEAPLIMTQILLRELKRNKGYIINISSITAKKISTYGCAYAATKAGLTHFSESLFEETRKYGVKVVTIHPDMTKTNFYDELNFREGDSEDSFITPECVADAVETVISLREGTVITDITLRPQKHLITKKVNKL